MIPFPTSLFWPVLSYIEIKFKHWWVRVRQRSELCDSFTAKCRGSILVNNLWLILPFLCCVNMLHSPVASWVGTASGNDDDSGATFFFSFLFLSTTTELCPTAMSTGSQRPPLLNLLTFQTAFFMQSFWLPVLSCCFFFFFLFFLSLNFSCC